ncbi:MAG TPA: hypothetical protein VF705_03230 [Longimicrobium sp.]|jgi:hypothetical protein
MSDRAYNRPKLDAFRAGQVFVLERDATWLNADKPRPFVLATDCAPNLFGTLIYGSTQKTERAASAACVEVLPRPFGVNANGLRARTLFYPGVLLTTRHDLLPAHAGTLHAAMDDLRQGLRSALGIGAGTIMVPGAPAGSHRGRIVFLHPVLGVELRTRYAVLLTEHRYSSEKRYQVIVPIFRGDGVRADPDVVRVGRQPWFTVFPQPTSTALLAAPVVQSVWHGDDIVAETAFVIDDDSLAALEERLCTIFEIEPPRISS